MKKTLFLSILISFNLYAHGENMLGPHGGYIRMPGTFHVELVPKENNTFNVYLMNVNNKEPKAEKSFVLLNIKQDKKLFNFNCMPKADYFECKSNEKIDLKAGAILVKAKRLEVVGDEANFPLPLELKK